MTQLKKLKQLDKIYLEDFNLVMNEMHRFYWGARLRTPARVCL